MAGLPLPVVALPEELRGSSGQAELLERAHFISLPLRVPFRGIRTRELVLFEGPAGWGEWAPFVEYPPEEAATWLRAALESAYLTPLPRMRETIALNGTIPALNGAELAALLDRFGEQHLNFGTYKIKVAGPGADLDKDAARVADVRAAFPQAHIRVDANAGWTVEQAVEAARRFGPLQYMEQPVATVAEMGELAGRLQAEGINVGLAVDENIRRAADPLQVLGAPGITNAVLKTAPLGGVRPTIAWMQKLNSVGIDVTVASALDSSVGMNAPLAAVASSPIESLAAGLATGTLFAEDLTPGRKITEGRMSTAPMEPEKARLEEFAMPAARREWWIARFKDSYPLLF
ncbi:MAG: o-succinylbenzoate synthase [Corynebacterium sp.]|nr:o-succinylbenzoate synthase [Corynebacterium sp.]